MFKFMAKFIAKGDPKMFCCWLFDLKIFTLTSQPKQDFASRTNYTGFHLEEQTRGDLLAVFQAAADALKQKPFRPFLLVLYQTKRHKQNCTASHTCILFA